MLPSELLLQGVNLMLLGMGVVFSFLVILVFSLRGMSSLAKKLDARAVLQDPADAADENDPELIAVISAAITRYRHSRR